EEHDAIRRAHAARLLCAEPRVVEVARERGVAVRELASHPRREPREQYPRDAVPERRCRWLRDVVEQAGGDDLLVRTERAKELRGALGVARIGRGSRGDNAERLTRAIEHQNPPRPSSSLAIASAGVVTSGPSTLIPM